VKGKVLEGVKVLEYCTMISGPYCTKLLADMGAEVVKIESPGTGDEARRSGPFPGDIPHQEKSGLFLYLNTNKRGITLDPGKPMGKEIFEGLVKDVDILVEDTAPGFMEQLGLGYEDLKGFNPGLIMTSISPFGRSGPNKDYKAYQLNTAHVSGQGYLLPIPSPNLERPPVKTGGNSCDCDAGLVTAVAVLSAFYWKGITGQGQFIELSKQEALMSMQRVESVTFANDGVTMTRQAQAQSRMPGGIMPCKDGYVVSVTPEEHQWKALMELVGNPEWSKEDWCRDQRGRSEHAQELNGYLIEWMKQHTKEEIFRKGQALSCPIAPINSAEDLLRSEQLNARDFFVEIEHPKAGRLTVPSSPYRFSKSPLTWEHPAPLLGEHNEDVLCERLGYTREDLVKLRETGVI